MKSDEFHREYTSLFGYTEMVADRLGEDQLKIEEAEARLLSRPGFLDHCNQMIARQREQMTFNAFGTPIAQSTTTTIEPSSDEKLDILKANPEIGSW